MRNLHPSTAAAWLLVLMSLAAAAPAWASDLPAFRGTVRDVRGQGIEGVEVLLAVSGRAARPVASVLSDLQGRFDVADLIPGAYKIAALKAGYRVFVGQIDTAAQRSVDLVMQPTAAGPLSGAASPVAPSWALRAPRRGILRDVAVGASPSDTARPTETMQVRVDQMFAVPAGPEDGSIDAKASPEASETRLHVDSWIHDQARVRIQGHRQSLATARPAPTRASSRNTSMQLAVDYDPRADDAIELNAYYDEGGYRLSDGRVGDGAAIGGGHRVWGYDADWKRQLDPRSRLAIGMDYRDATLEDTDPRRGSGADSLTASTVAVRGAYEQIAGSSHRIEVAMGARVSHGPSDPLVTGDERQQAWDVRVDARDSWAVAAPFRLLYGLGARQTRTDDPRTWIVPSVGGEWDEDGWKVRARVSYDAGVDRRPGERDVGERDPLGYDAEIVMPLTEGIELTGQTTRSPVERDSRQLQMESWNAAGEPVLLRDGAMEVEESRLRLSEQRGPTSTWFELAHGRASGARAVLLAFDGPADATGGRLEFVGARFGLGSEPLGADLLVEYTRVASRPEAAEPDDSQVESLDLRVRKVLTGIRAPGSWHMLLGMRVGSVHSERLDRWQGQGGDPETIVALNRRLSLGLSVMF